MFGDGAEAYAQEKTKELVVKKFLWHGMAHTTFRSGETIRLVQQFDVGSGTWFYWFEALDENGKLVDRSLTEELTTSFIEAVEDMYIMHRRRRKNWK